MVDQFRERLLIDTGIPFSFTIRMRSLRFHQPVEISLRFGRSRLISSVPEAGKVLLHEWPEGENSKCNRAAKLVIEALHGRRKPSEVRNALIDAAKASGILVDTAYESEHPIAAE
jgi:hypothetical protein